MSRLLTRRSRKIDEDFTSIEKNLADSASKINRDVLTILELTGFMHHSIINNTGDLDENDRADSNSKISPIMASLQANIQQLFECYNVYNDDPAIYEENLLEFISKYPTAAYNEVSKRYS